MLLDFEKNIADFIKVNHLLNSTDSVLLAVSGGADSTALLYAMHALKTRGILSTDLFCAHINHQLRGSQSDADEDFIVAEAARLNLEIRTRKVDVQGFALENKLSIETAARKLRIENLMDIAKSSGCNTIATAHQKDDNAETVLQRLARGTGFRGLGGIWPERTFGEEIRFVRPLLCVGRKDIIEYLNKRNLKWRIDRTNENCKYRRNYIRHRLIPALQKECSKEIAEQLFELSKSAQRFYSLVRSYADKVWPNLAICKGNTVTLDLKLFSDQQPAVKVEIIRQSLAVIGSGERDLTQEHYEKILQLAEQAVSGKKIELPDRFLVWREYGDLVFAPGSKKCQPEKESSGTETIAVPGRTRLGNCLVEATVLDADHVDIEKFKAEKTDFVEWFDFDKLNCPLAIRARRRGDRFWPLGLSSEKKVGKFLTDAKVPQEIRQKTLIVSDNKKIIWTWPIRIGEQVRISDKTRKILQLRITETSSVK